VCTEAQLSLLVKLFAQLDVNLQALLAICAKLSISLSVIASLWVLHGARGRTLELIRFLSLVNLKAQIDVSLSLCAKILGLWVLAMIHDQYWSVSCTAYVVFFSYHATMTNASSTLYLCDTLAKRSGYSTPGLPYSGIGLIG
jgi:hypothetical protein